MGPEGQGLARLSPRQREVAELVSRGLQDKQIAAALGISEETVGFHLRRCFARLGVRSRVGLVMLCFCRCTDV